MNNKKTSKDEQEEGLNSNNVPAGQGDGKGQGSAACVESQVNTEEQFVVGYHSPRKYVVCSVANGGVFLFCLFSVVAGISFFGGRKENKTPSPVCVGTYKMYHNEGRTSA